MRKIQASAWLLTPVTRNKRNIDLAITMIPSFIVRIRARGTLEKIQMRVRTTRRTVRNQERGGRDREGRRDQDFFIIEAGEGEEGRWKRREPIMRRSCEAQWSMPGWEREREALNGEKGWLNPCGIMGERATRRSTGPITSSMTLSPF